MLFLMGFKHRKLFPALTSTNQSIDCQDFCNPSCPFNCYPYPEIIFLPPPSPPPPAVSTDTLIHKLKQNQHLSPFVIITVSLLVFFFLLVSYYAIIVKYCSNWNRSRDRDRSSEFDDTVEQPLDSNQGPSVIDHPIWFITTVGLQQAVINSITVCKYKRGEGLVEGTDCSVCLSEFQQDDTLRLLPKCSHAFHIHCIDTWLKSHTNCPLCRAPIVSSDYLAPATHNQPNSSVNEETHMGNYEGGGDEGQNQVRNTGGCENRVRTEDEGEVVLQVDHAADKNKAMREVVQVPPSMRRSVSMNSSTDGAIYLGLGPDFSSDESESSSVNQTRTLEEMASSSVEQTVHQSQVSMNRSFSGGWKFFLPRHNQSPDSILPL